MIEARGLAKAFGHKVVLRGVDLSVAPGELVVLVGPNGAGKTTLLRILATLSRPTAGQVQLAGFALPREAAGARRRLGVVLHQTLLYDNLTAEENLRFYGRMYGTAGLAMRIPQVLAEVGLAHRRADQVRTFSRGQQQRLALARALLHEPQVLLLDEPYTGLDPAGSAALDGMLRGLADRGCTVLLTIHDLAHGLALSDRIAILTKGRIARTVPSREIAPEQFLALYAELTGPGTGDVGSRAGAGRPGVGRQL